MNITRLFAPVCVVLLIFTGCLVIPSGEKLSAPEPVYASEGEYRDAVRLTWTEVPGAQAYAVYRSEEGTSHYELLDLCSDSICEMLNKGSEQDGFEVIPGSIYSYAVAAVDQNGNEGRRSAAVPGWAYPSSTPEDLLIDYRFNMIDLSDIQPGEVSAFNLLVDFAGSGNLSVTIDGSTETHLFTLRHQDVDSVFQLICDRGLFRMDGTSVSWPIKKMPNDDQLITSGAGFSYEIPLKVAGEVIGHILEVKAALISYLPADLINVLT